MLGGIHIPFEKGAHGHSDADVLLHAICDALLGALALGDIGTHFPDTDPKYKNIQSSVFLKETINLVVSSKARIVNIDATVNLERPILRPHIPDIRASIAKIAGLDIEQVSVKAKTSEKMGFIGMGDGISAVVVALIESTD